ncbi:MAG: hypothetical protein ACXW4T_07445 [Candidatus Limnocylindrales bacterium]
MRRAFFYGWSTKPVSFAAAVGLLVCGFSGPISGSDQIAPTAARAASA